MNTNKEIYELSGTTVDVIIFTVHESQLKVLLAKRAENPYEGLWSIPGGFIKKEETLEKAALRILKDKTGVSNVYLEQLYTFGDIKRDPRSRVITVAYFALIPWTKLRQPKSKKVAETAWFNSRKIPTKLAFDHKKIFDHALNRIVAKAGYSNIAYGLLPEMFRLSELKSVYEAIIGKELDKRNFRKKMLSTNLLEDTGKKDVGNPHRPAKLYKFKEREIVFFD